MITVIGGGVIGTALGGYNDVILLRRRLWESLTESTRKDLLDDTDVLVNAAAIAGAAKCKEAGYAEVLYANVFKARQYTDIALAHNVPMVLLSTRGLYKQQTMPKRPDGNIGALRVGAPVYPHNLYCASKILMEQAVPEARHFRLPMFEETLKRKDEQWSWVQDTYTSYITADRLMECLRLLRNARPGIYQAQSEVVYLPDVFPKMTVRHDAPPHMTASVPLVESPLFTVDEPADEFDFEGYAAWDAWAKQKGLSHGSEPDYEAECEVSRVLNLDPTQIGCLTEVQKELESHRGNF